MTRAANILKSSAVTLLLAACGGTGGLTGSEAAKGSPAAADAKVDQTADVDTSGSDESAVDLLESDKLELVADDSEIFIQGPIARLNERPSFENADALLNEAKAQVLGELGLEINGLRLDRVEHDPEGFTVIRYQQVINGTDAIGAELRFHVDTHGLVFAANGTARGKLPTGTAVVLTEGQARSVILDAYAGADESAISGTSLKYLRSGEGFRPVYESTIFMESTGTPTKDKVFVDAESGEILARHPLIVNERFREVYTARNGTSTPGTLVIREGGAASSDAVVMAAYNNTGATYDFFRSVFSRDSYDNRGAKLISTVRYSRNYVNAYWDGTQMVYGDGDGVTSLPLAQSLDVTAHELAHGVTEYTAGLVYQGESGALNEAFSDIMASATDAWKKGAVDANTWKIGDDVWTPGTADDALRYMNDPTADGISYDYWPTRYTGTQDNGGVHMNSGIANLAFYLLSQGGKHPRGKTSNTVPALGIVQARAIFYRAHANYATSTTRFEGYRTATARAAQDLYGAAAAAAVHEAWNAVGVPGGTTTTPPTGSVLTNKVAVQNLAGAKGAQRAFTFVVPANTAKVTFQMSLGSGDADMYIRFNQAATTTAYDYRPYLNGNNETVSLNNPRAGTWHIMLNGYSAYAGVKLIASY